jgi:DNA (cytosine-5)-methyltransferase 1
MGCEPINFPYWIKYRTGSGLTGKDLLAGYGGLTTAAEWLGVQMVTAINHNQHVIFVHADNHPKTNHVCDDLFECQPWNFPRTDILIGSPTCTYFTQARSENVLTLAHESQLHLFKDDQRKYEELVARHQGRHTMYGILDFVEYHRYKYVFLENVVDVHKWSLFEDWCQRFVKLGYKLQFAYWNTQFFHDLNGVELPYAGQSRDRWYCIANRLDMPTPNLAFAPLAPCPNCNADVRAIQVWKNPYKKWGKYGLDHGQYYYGCPTCVERKKNHIRPLPVEPYHYAGINHVDLTVPIWQVGDPDRPGNEISIATRRRIKIGLERYGNSPIIFKNSRNDRLSFKSAMLDPLYTITQTNDQMIIAPSQLIDLARSHGNNIRSRPASSPMFTQTGVGTQGFFVALHNNGTAFSFDESINTATAGASKTGLAISGFMTHNYGGRNVASLAQPLHTAKAHGYANSIVVPGFMAVTRSRNRSRVNGGAYVWPWFATYNGGHSVMRNSAESLPTMTQVERTGMVITEADVDSCYYRTLRSKIEYPGFIYSEIGAAQGFPQGPEGYRLLPEYTTDQITSGYGNAVHPGTAAFGIACILRAIGEL